MRSASSEGFWAQAGSIGEQKLGKNRKGEIGLDAAVICHIIRRIRFR